MLLQPTYLPSHDNSKVSNPTDICQTIQPLTIIYTYPSPPISDPISTSPPFRVPLLPYIHRQQNAFSVTQHIFT
ncbi:hypothetical protein GLYMA_10G215600v4 [Glycine max]|nr:hypothetical protein GLYMA_10G215600v4 [Glycine max]KAH1139447.1 hypothetical protein GYH30_028716 [Glycine max]